MTRLTNIDIAAAVERAVDALATEKERGSAPQAALLLLGNALARDYRTAPSDRPTTRTFYTKDRLRLAFPAVGATAPSEKSFHATPDQLGRWLQGRRHRDHVATEPVDVQLVGPTAPQRGDGGISRHLYLHVVITATTLGTVLYDSRATRTTFTPAEPAPYRPTVATINDIPAPLPDFVGRDVEFNDIVAWLSGSEASAPTFILHGPPGSGKTELAIRAAHALSEQFSIRLLIDGRGLDPVPPSSSTLLRTIQRRCGGNPEDEGAAEAAFSRLNASATHASPSFPWPNAFPSAMTAFPCSCSAAPRDFTHRAATTTPTASTTNPASTTIRTTFTQVGIHE